MRQSSVRTLPRFLFPRNKCCKLMDEYVVASVANLEALKKGFSEMKQAVDKVMVRGFAL